MGLIFRLFIGGRGIWWRDTHHHGERVQKQIGDILALCRLCGPHGHVVRHNGEKRFAIARDGQ